MANLSQVTEAVFTSRFEDQTTAGANAAARSLDSLGNAFDAVDERLTRNTRTAKTWVNQADVVTQAENRLTRATRDLEAARRSLATSPDVSDEQRTRTIQTLAERVRQAEVRYNALKGSQSDAAQAANATSSALKLQAHEWTNLIAQAQDFVVQVGSGQGIFTPLLQQAPQATGAVGGVGRAVQLVTGLFTPFRVAMVAATAASAAVALSYNSQEGALAAMQTRLRGVTSDYAAMGRQAEAAAKAAVLATPGLSIDTARSAQIAFAGAAPRNSGLDFGALTRQAADFAATMGIDVAAGVDRFAQGMRDPVALVDELARQHFPGMNEQLRLTAQRLVEGGQRGDAFALVIGRVNEQTAGAAKDGLSPFASAMDTLGRRLKELGQEIGDFLATPGRQLAEWMTRRLGNVSEGGMFDPSLGSSTGIGRWLGWEPWGGSRAPDPAAQAAQSASQVEIQEMIRQEALRQGRSPEFMLRIARNESGFRQFGSDGQVLNNEGALGAFQIRTPAAQDAARALGMSGFDRLTPAGNIRMGVWYAGQRLDAAGGDERQAAFRYNQGDTGYERAVAGQNPRALAGGQDYLRKFDQPLTIEARAVTLDTSGATAAGRVGAREGDKQFGPPSPSDDVNSALRMARGEAAVPGQVGTSLATQRAGLEEAIALAERAKEAAVGNTQVQESLTVAQEKWRATLEGLRGPQEEVLRGLQRASESAHTYDPAQRAVNEAIRDYEDRMRAVGQLPTDAGREAVRTAKLNELSAAYFAAGREVDRSIQSQDRLAVAWGEGREAVQRLTAEEKAREAVRVSGIEGDEAQKAAVKGLADEYERLTQKQADNALRASNDAAQRNLDYLDKERQLVGATADERERELAAYRARQNAVASGAKDEDAITKAQQLARQTVDANNKTQQLRNSWQAIPGFVEETASTIKGALVSAIAAGEAGSIRLGNIWRAIKASLIGTIAELASNQFLNGAFGGTRPTLGGIMTVLGGTGAAGGTATSASGGVSTFDAASGIFKLSGGAGGSTVGGMVNSFDNWAAGSGLFASTSAPTSASAAAGLAGADPNAVAGLASNNGTLFGTASGTIGGVAGVAGGGYALYSGLKRGGVGGYTQAAGGIAGVVGGLGTLAAAGGAVGGGIAAAAPWLAAAGPYGLAAAAVLAIVGSLLPGQKPSDMTGVYRGNLHSDTSEVGGLTGDRFSQANRDLATQVGEQVKTLAQGLQTVTGASAIPFNYEIKAGNRDGIAALYGADGGKWHEYERNEESVQQLVQDMTQALIDSMKGLASAEVQSVITHSNGTEDVLQNLDWYNGTYRPMTAGAKGDPITQWQQQLETLVKPIDEAIAKAKSLGIAEDDLNLVRQKSVDGLIKQREATLQGLQEGDEQRRAVANGVDEVTLRIQNWAKTSQAEVTALNDSLIQMGLSQEERTPFINSRWQTLDAEYQGLLRQQGQTGVSEAAAKGAQDQQTRAGYWQASRSAEGRDYISSVEGVRTNWAENGASYAALGLDPDRLYWQQLQSELNGLSNDQLRDVATSFRGVDDAAADLAEQMLALGGSAAQVAEDLAKRQQAEQGVVGVLGSITDFIQSMQTDDSSLLSPQAKLGLLERDFSDLGSRAVAGDFDAISALPSAAGDYRNAAREYYGSSAGFGAAQDRILSVFESVGSIPVETLTNSAMASIMKDTTEKLGDRVVASQNDLRTEIRLLRLEISALVAD